jgi:hypothetical protein
MTFRTRVVRSPPGRGHAEQRGAMESVEHHADNHLVALGEEVLDVAPVVGQRPVTGRT